MTKTCSKCGEEKPKSEFTKAKKNKDGLHSWCNPCKARSLRLHRETHPDKAAKSARVYALKTRYGLTIEDFHTMWDGQGGKCKICSQPLTLGASGHAIDHNHTTGDVRGILCYPCNVGLGQFRDNPAILEKAASYLHAQGNYAYDA